MPPKIVSDAAARIEPGSQVQCSATGTPPIYTAVIQNFTVLMNTTNTASSKLYQEGNYTCVATSKYGTDGKHFVVKGGEKIRYFVTNPMQEVGVGQIASSFSHLFVIILSQEKLQTIIIVSENRKWCNVFYGLWICIKTLFTLNE